MERFKVIKMIKHKLNDEDYCRNINCGTVTDYVCILLEEGYLQNDIHLRSVDTGSSCHIRINLDVELREATKKLMSSCCGFYPAIFE